MLTFEAKKEIKNETPTDTPDEKKRTKATKTNQSDRFLRLLKGEAVSDKNKTERDNEIKYAERDIAKTNYIC